MFHLMSAILEHFRWWREVVGYNGVSTKSKSRFWTKIESPRRIQEIGRTQCDAVWWYAHYWTVSMESHEWTQIINLFVSIQLFVNLRLRSRIWSGWNLDFAVVFVVGKRERPNYMSAAIAWSSSTVERSVPKSDGKETIQSNVINSNCTAIRNYQYY